jgi:hypothetical protein
MKTSALTGAALDWAVAKCLGDLGTPDEWLALYNDGTGQEHFSNNWSESGPIIEREGIELCRLESSSFGIEWRGQIDCDCRYYGPTPLIAAMRVYVASKLGDEVEIPEELGGRA